MEDFSNKHLEKLTAPENDAKFPNELMTAILSKDGQLNRVVLSKLQPEASQFVKNIYSRLQNAKDTFGARVTNFDVQAYLNQLPNLMMSPESRRAVLKDLMVTNKINQLHTKGVLDIMDRYGSKNMNLSKANQLFRKEYGAEMQKIMDQHLNPQSDGQWVDELPDPQQFSGKIATDPETGKRFRSNGQTWEPM
jgi:hypothetical protein